MSMFSYTCVLLHLALYCSTARAADVDLKCPKWRNECPASLYCTLQNANFSSAKCNTFDMITEFRLKSDGSKVATLDCVVNFTTSCDGTFNDKGCACRKDTSGYTFQRDLVVTETKHKNGSWFCQPRCFDGLLQSVLSTSSEDTCFNIKLSYFTLEWHGIVLLCFGTALVIVGIIMIVASGLGISGKVGIALGGVGYVLLIAGSALMTVAYIDDEPAGIAFLWVGSVLLIVLGIGVLIIGIFLQRNFGVLANAGTGLMWVGGTLAIIGGIVATTERCASDKFPTTLQEVLGLVLAVIGFVVYVVGIIIGIVAL